jgi:glucose/arabinose dehydrogenase
MHISVSSRILIPITIVTLLALGVLAIARFTPTTSSNNTISTTEPAITTNVVIEGLSNPWDLTFVSKDVFIYTQRSGQIRAFNLASKEDWLITTPQDVYVVGEGGLLGAIADVDFASNHYLYTCMNVQGPAVAVVRWQLSEDLKQVLERKDIVTGLPSNRSGRHSGCRLAMGVNGHLWIGTGDTAVGSLPQDPQSLGGKVLRVDREGQGVAGNLAAPFDSRIFSYGHRNVQGIVLFPAPIDGVYGFTSEHGPNIDDEVNLLVKGNFGWDPVPGYNEAVPMTNLQKYLDAVSAIWSSGRPTIAVSGMTIVRGEKWQGWDGAVLLAVQRGQHVRLQKYDADFKLTRDEQMLNNFGRIRTIVQGPDESLYVLTDNGRGRDKVIKVDVIL